MAYIFGKSIEAAVKAKDTQRIKLLSDILYNMVEYRLSKYVLQGVTPPEVICSTIAGIRNISEMKDYAFFYTDIVMRLIKTLGLQMIADYNDIEPGDSIVVKLGPKVFQSGVLEVKGKDGVITYLTYPAIDGNINRVRSKNFQMGIRRSLAYTAPKFSHMFFFQY